MERALKYFLIIVPICFFHLLSFAQKIGITSLPVEQELPSLTVNCTFQDSEGFIWFATAGGLSRFDAFNLLNFKLKNKAGSIITDQNITSIGEVKGRLLLATQNGLFVMDKKSYEVLPFPDRALEHANITTIHIDRNANIWIGTLNAIYVYRPDLSLVKKYTHDPSNKNSIPPGTVSLIFEDSSGNMWMSIWGAGLFKLNKIKDRFISYPKLGSRNNPFRMLEDDHGQLWIATWGDGLFLFNPDDPKNLYRELTIKSKRRVGKEELVYDLLQDRHKKYIWVLSFSGVSTFVYTTDGALEEIDQSSLFDNTSNIFNNVYQDRTGTLWLSIGGKGVSTIHFDRPNTQYFGFEQVKQRHGLSPILNMLYRDNEGQLWFNLERIGLGKFDPKTNKVYTYSNTSFKDLLAIRAVTSAFEINNEIWVGSSYESTISIFRKSDGDIILKRQINLLEWSPSAGIPQFFFADTRNNIWIATSNGIFVQEKDNPELFAIQNIKDEITAISEGQDGSVWVATKSSGIYQLSPHRPWKTNQQVGKHTLGLLTNQIETMAIDETGNLWIGTKDARLLSYHVQQKKIDEFANSQLFSKNQLLDIICIGQTIWLSTTRNIYKVNPGNRNIIEYTASDGLNVNMFAKRAYAIDRKNKSVYFGGYNGIVHFEHSDFVAEHADRVIVSDVKINNQSAVLRSENQKFDFYQQSLVLEPEDQNLEISFTSLEYSHPDKIRYAYKLEGIDKDWVLAPRERHFATYNNLGKGNYRFLIKATDLNNKWNSAVTELTIRKKPAFYESTVAYLIYASILIFLIYYTVTFALNRLQLRSDLRIAQIEKEKANELIQTKLSYFTNISHDLLTPLTIISCLIDDVQITTKKNLSQFEKMRLNLDRLKRLLQQILDFRRVENRQMELRVSFGEISTFINELCSAYFSPLSRKKNIRFEILTPERPIAGYFDADKLDKILFNLLSNAFKYTPQNGHISLSYRTTEERQGPSLTIQIVDTGIGIAPEEIDRIFIPFYNNRQANQHESNGIGLALTKELVEIHHGNIQVESAIEKGTKFTINLPIQKEAYLETELQDINGQFMGNPAFFSGIEEPISTATPPAKNEMQQLNLLLVEDNEDLRQTIQSILSRNYNVFQANHGEEALAILHQHEIDIVISDIMMPVMDGLTLCKTIKNSTEINHIPVILLTAKNSIDDRIECYQAGADGYVSKPFELKVLEARIHSFVINKRTKQLDFKANPQINISTLDYTPLDEQFLNKMIAVIESNLGDDQFDVVKLGDKLGLSKSTLYRKTKVLLDLSPSEFIKNIRLKHACQMMDQDKSISVSEVAFATGFSDPRYFSTCFKAEFGITPTDYHKNNSPE
ncbi:hybrid sensor histidine kinase/response regulator transcription factor [Sphingobacterium pedocola]|uniref:histidine kinase n=1 Tax=Sphingobacterium pedocola TaxID=2082722 RepID=A0ABR9TA49_9SPHI|nr:response regulator [Sphingobacterium pedocola]MBE8721522.1 hybrid sensor histidine kinase/response regulator [Sphingobacterium pedocola]